MLASEVDFELDATKEHTLDQTYDQLLQWFLLKSQAQTDNKRNELISKLVYMAEKGKAELWEAHKRAVAYSNVGNDRESQTMVEKGGGVTTGPESAPDENIAPALASVDDLAERPKRVVTSNPIKKRSAVKVIHVDITGGPYTGKSFDLKPTPRAPCFVGRSAGKKFRDKGISLPDDGEVSTTHGKFIIKSGKAFFVDTGSTNGTIHNDQELDVNTPLELETGTELLIGATLVVITLGY